MSASRPSRRLAVALVCILASVPSAAGPAEEADARRLFAEGNALFDGGELVAALDRFRSAHAKWDNPKILPNIGTTLKQLGRFAEAADVYERFLRHPQADPKQKAEVEEALRDVVARVAVMTIACDDPTVRVSLDGRVVPPQSLKRPFYVEPGAHVILGERPGAPPWVVRTTTEAGKTYPVTIEIPVAPAPSASVAPPPPPATSAPAAATTPARIPTLAYVGFGVGAAGVAVGAIAGVLAFSKTSSARQTPTQSSVDSARATGNVSTVSFAVGGVGAAAGLIALYLARPRVETATSMPRVEVTIGPASLSLKGSF